MPLSVCQALQAAMPERCSWPQLSCSSAGEKGVEMRKEPISLPLQALPKLEVLLAVQLSFLFGFFQFPRCLENSRKGVWGVSQRRSKRPRLLVPGRFGVCPVSMCKPE